MNKRQIYLPLIIVISIIAGIFISLLMDNDQEGMFKKPQGSQTKLNAVLNFVDDNYVDTVNKEKIVEDAIPEILENLDPHSIYIPAKDVKEMNEPLEGNFEGIGIQFNMRHDTLLVLHVISGGPSEKAGLRPGDRIISVDDSTIAGQDISTRDIMSMLKGEKGTKVTVGIKRHSVDSLLHYTITRDEIPLYSVDVAYMPADDIGYIKISSFSNTTYSEFISAVRDLKLEGMKKLILDLRSNSGGIMDAATKITDEFLTDNKLIVYTQGRKHGKSEIFSTDKRRRLEDTDIAILIDEFSASASEIVAGAIQDNDRGWIIGRRSFGKGLVQEPVRFDDGSALRLTVARYYTPAGRCIQKPYDDGLEEYYNDIIERYKHGELLVADSIDFADSLKYKTENGRNVYGGGGIMPDIFVPVDTSGSTNLYKKIRNKNKIYDFAMKYTEQNRDKLEGFDNIKELSVYFYSENIFDDFVEYLNESGIKINEKQMEKSREILSIQLNAMIGRNIFNDDGFYPVIHQLDTTFNTALKILEEERELIE